MSVKGTDAAEWDKNTWPPLRDLAQNRPEAGVHFQRETLSTPENLQALMKIPGTEIYNRKKDVDSATATWL